MVPQGAPQHAARLEGARLAESILSRRFTCSLPAHSRLQRRDNSGPVVMVLAMSRCCTQVTMLTAHADALPAHVQRNNATGHHARSPRCLRSRNWLPSCGPPTCATAPRPALTSSPSARRVPSCRLPWQLQGGAVCITVNRFKPDNVPLSLSPIGACPILPCFPAGETGTLVPLTRSHVCYHQHACNPHRCRKRVVRCRRAIAAAVARPAGGV